MSGALGGLVPPPRRAKGACGTGGGHRGPLGPGRLAVVGGCSCPASRAVPRRPSPWPGGSPLGGPLRQFPRPGGRRRSAGRGFVSLARRGTSARRGWDSAACGRRARGPHGFLGVLASACGLALAVAGPGARSLSRCIEGEKGAPLRHSGKSESTVRFDAAAGRPGRKIGRFCWKFPETLCILPIAAAGVVVVH